MFAPWPNTTYAKVDKLSKNDIVPIYETSSNGWHRIGTNKWVNGTYIQEV
ncbi:MAG: SH3 domain-containing protein [Saprospiraceae bacterium]